MTLLLMALCWLRTTARANGRFCLEPVRRAALCSGSPFHVSGELRVDPLIEPYAPHRFNIVHCASQEGHWGSIAVHGATPRLSRHTQRARVTDTLQWDHFL